MFEQGQAGYEFQGILRRVWRPYGIGGRHVPYDGHAYRGKGMLGRTLCRELEGFEVIPTDLPETDILQEDALAAAGQDSA